MITGAELWKHYRFLTDRDSLSKEDLSVIERFLMTEYEMREKKRVAHLLRMSGIKRVKRLEDFDWTFNPKIPREKIMEFAHTEWLKKPCNLVLIGPTGVGKTHIAHALCHDAIMKDSKPSLSPSSTSRKGVEVGVLPQTEMDICLFELREQCSLLDYFLSTSSHRSYSDLF